MSEQDRIRLAEAIGWRKHFCGVTLMWVDPATGTGMNSVEDLPDPFTDANDDYAVLEWIRTGVDDPRKDIMRSMMRNMVTNTIKPIKYQVGDYARVALQVLGDD